MKGPSEEAVVSALEKETDPLLREFLEKELDWIRRGRPKDELIPEHIAERMTGEAALGGGVAWDEKGNKVAEW